MATLGWMSLKVGRRAARGGAAELRDAVLEEVESLGGERGDGSLSPSPSDQRSGRQLQILPPEKMEEPGHEMIVRIPRQGGLVRQLEDGFPRCLSPRKYYSLDTTRFSSVPVVVD